MTLLSTTLLAFSMSTDAFAAAIGKGAAVDHPRFREALRTGLIFGVVEGLTPLIGWALGIGASRYIAAWDHWIVFVLLFALGARMIRAGLETPDADEEAPAATPGRHAWWLIAATAVITSIDALTVGIGLAFMEVNILLTSLAIGAATTLMATLGVMLGRRLGVMIGQRAEMLGGVVLIGIGTAILTEHLGLW
ncbi:manganese efflux pump MntP [Halomonas organivorans]|uniref:Putative manganese efflux pump MntP n=1 Tax=Halomonas organivorans TaxID=257772 RepID=A0A7W5G692_9GAMM|nr:manganese efflux pump MntP [Halomonas organivorans]MBB3141905.1 putative Mn2+ efflux pump MntP [Halomonas organivorans]